MFFGRKHRRTHLDSLRDAIRQYNAGDTSATSLYQYLEYSIYSSGPAVGVSPEEVQSVMSEEGLDLQRLALAAKSEGPSLEGEKAARGRIIEELRKATDQYNAGLVSDEAFDLAMRRARKDYDAVPVTAVVAGLSSAIGDASFARLSSTRSDEFTEYARRQYPNVVGPWGPEPMVIGQGAIDIAEMIPRSEEL